MAGPIYAADPPGALLRRAIDGFDIVYHRASGTTHMLAEPAPTLLDALAEGPCDAAGLLARLDGDPADAPIVAARLAELAEAGLVRAG
jgi:PqqD family protein of HPr-rel-A system